MKIDEDFYVPLPPFSYIWNPPPVTWAKIACYFIGVFVIVRRWWRVLSSQT